MNKSSRLIYLDFEKIKNLHIQKLQICRQLSD